MVSVVHEEEPETLIGDFEMCGCATNCKYLHSILSRVFSPIQCTSQSTESMQRTEERVCRRLLPAQCSTLPAQEFDKDYLIHTLPLPFVCIVIIVGNIPNSANMVFAYLVKQAYQII